MPYLSQPSSDERIMTVAVAWWNEVHVRSWDQRKKNSATEHQEYARAPCDLEMNQNDSSWK